MIRTVELSSKKFKGGRTMYSSSSILVAILSKKSDSYDVESIGEKIFPDGFGCVEPPGPSFGFGVIELSEDEENGKVRTSSLVSRVGERDSSEDDGDLRSCLEGYFDAHFIVDPVEKKIRQIKFSEFIKVFEEGNHDFVHFVEFEPD